MSHHGFNEAARGLRLIKKKRVVVSYRSSFAFRMPSIEELESTCVHRKGMIQCARCEKYSLKDDAIDVVGKLLCHTCGNMYGDLHW